LLNNVVQILVNSSLIQIISLDYPKFKIHKSKIENLLFEKLINMDPNSNPDFRK